MGRSPAILRLPRAKGALLMSALLHMVSRPFVDTAVLRALTGIWIFGALVNRDVLSIPFAVFHMIDQYENCVIRWWESARAEVRAMAYVVVFTKVHLGCQLPLMCFATDSSGNNDNDFGGFGL